jgi:small subunit ribosomal protein S2
MPVVTMQQLLEAGIHFGHQTRRWNPKMAKYIYGQRNGIYIIDLQKSMRLLLRAHKLVRDTVASGGTILFVGTKKQAQEAVAREAERCGMYYINSRWLGGTLTNFRTVQQSVRNLLDLEQREATGKLDQLSKKEAARLRKELARLDKNLRGIKTMDRMPSLMFVIDTKKEAIAVREAERMGVTCIGVVDTNADPDCVPYPVPGNDDAIRALNLFCSVIANAVIEGRGMGQKGGDAVQDQVIAAATAAPEAPESTDDETDTDDIDTVDDLDDEGDE